MPPTFVASRRVEFRDTDAAGIVHFASFFAWMEEVEHEFLRELGTSVMLARGDGRISWPRVHVSCDFRSVLHFSDVVDVELTLAAVGSSSVTYEFRFVCESRMVAEGKVVAVCCRIYDDRPPAATPIPAEIREKLDALMK